MNWQPDGTKDYGGGVTAKVSPEKGGWAFTLCINGVDLRTGSGYRTLTAAFRACDATQRRRKP